MILQTEFVRSLKPCRLPVVILLLALLAACASSERKIMQIPNLYLGEQKLLFSKLMPNDVLSTVDFLYVTDRVPEGELAVGDIRYGYGRSNSLAVGNAQVEFVGR